LKHNTILTYAKKHPLAKTIAFKNSPERVFFRKTRTYTFTKSNDKILSEKQDLTDINSMVSVKTNKTLLLLFTLLLVGSLININTFGPVTLSAYFFYTILGSLIAVLVLVGFIKNKQPTTIPNPLPIAVLTLLAVYYILNGLINTQGGINLRHYIILVDAVLLASYCILLTKGSINLLSISKIIVFITIIEALICILQQLTIIPSLNPLFKVTGSNVNPNVTAMFLAMAFPALLLVLIKGSKTYRIIAIISITTSLFALAFLKCRTAFIGTAVSTILIINYQYQLLHKLRNKLSKAILIIIAIISITLITIAFTLLYHSKQASSDGRLFIWKISLQAITNKPVFGSGYGQFEHDYNLAQANYFATKAATQQEIYNASYVHMSYNEFLENLFEGGAIGLMLFVGLLITLLVSPITTPKEQGVSLSLSKAGKMEKNSTSIGFDKLNLTADHAYYAYAGIFSFTIMCFFNFTVQALPVRALFILYASVSCVNSQVRSTTFQRLLTFIRPSFSNGTPFRAGVFGSPLGVGVLVFSFFLFFKLLTISKSYNQCKTILETTNEVDGKEALQQMATLKSDLSKSTYYWRNYGELLVQTRHYDAAIEKFNKALDFSSDPNLYMQLGNSYSKKGLFTDAMHTYTLTSNIEPHRFAPKYGLMKLYGFVKDTTTARKLAQEIIAMNPKVESDKVEYYKKEARQLINN